jgi:DNA-binding transcriptional ArsR family regulator
MVPGRRRLDARSLLAFAHPLRIQLRNELRLRGPATASQLARRFGESSGATSYHLRMLARHGFIEPDDRRASGRERWWRAVPVQLHIEDSDFQHDPAARGALRMVASELNRQSAEHLRTWRETGDRWSQLWRDASEDAVYVANLDPREAAAMRDELDVVLFRYTQRQVKPGTRVVEVLLNVFPTGDPE